jgi:hypothetical protein
LPEPSNEGVSSKGGMNHSPVTGICEEAMHTFLRKYLNG